MGSNNAAGPAGYGVVWSGLARYGQERQARFGMAGQAGRGNEGFGGYRHGRHGRAWHGKER